HEGAADVGARQIERVEQRRGGVGEVGRRERALARLAAADARVVEDQGRALARELRHLERQPAAARAADAGREQEGRTLVSLPVELVVELAAVDDDVRHVVILTGRGSPPTSTFV